MLSSSMEEDQDAIEKGKRSSSKQEVPSSIDQLAVMQMLIYDTHCWTELREEVMHEY